MIWRKPWHPTRVWENEPLKERQRARNQAEYGAALVWLFWAWVAYEILAGLGIISR